MSDVINAIKRLERAGAENSRATQKLRQAAADVADLVISQVPRDVELPRGYSVRTMYSNISATDWLYQRAWLEGGDGPEDVAVNVLEGGYLHGDFNCPLMQTPRAVLLTFAKDVAEGWLDELAAWAEKRAADAEQAAAILDTKLA